MRKICSVIICLILLAIITTKILCAAPSELMVSAAASLTDAFTEIGKAYEKKNPGNTIRFNFASSGALATQIEQGAPVDVFASADVKNIDRLQKNDLVVPSSRTIFASNTIVIIVPASSKLNIRNLKDLKSSKISHIGIGDPSHVPNGKYVQQALEKANIWNAINSKLVMGNDVRQVRTYVQRGEVEAGFVFGSDVRVNGVRVAYIVPAKMHKPIEYAAAVVKESKYPGSAREFLSFVKSKAGQRILAKYGFLPGKR